MGKIPELEPSGPHLVYLVLSFFLILYALFSEFIRNRLHLSEPPLATLTGIAFGPLAADILGDSEWRFQDNINQELARIITCIQVFAVGLDLPSGYVKKHWKGIALLLGPNMIYGWLVSTCIIKLILNFSWKTAFIIAATLTPTDPVLSASVLGEARFSLRVPKRLRHLLAAESGCNDGTAFPFLYAAVWWTIEGSTAEFSKMFFLDTILWQCGLGIVTGITIGFTANRALKFSVTRGYSSQAALLVFYLLLAIFSTGVGSTLGLDDFLVAFSAGSSFCWDGWFHERTKEMKLPVIVDLLLNSSLFVFFGTIIPWDKYTGQYGVGRLFACLVLILLLRRIPSIFAIKKFLPEVRTWNEAMFAGHFGPMGVGAMFLAMEARGRLENGTAAPEPHPPSAGKHLETIQALWPVVSFIVLGSIMVHGLSAAVMSVYGHLTRDPKRRASVPGGEQDLLTGMDGGGDDDSRMDQPTFESSSESEDEMAANGRIRVS